MAPQTGGGPMPGQEPSLSNPFGPSLRGGAVWSSELSVAGLCGRQAPSSLWRRWRCSSLGRVTEPQPHNLVSCAAWEHTCLWQRGP